jgi:hypothetical protein
MASVVAPTHVAEAQVVATAEAGAQANHPGLVAQHLDPGRGLFLPVQGLHQKGVLRQDSIVSPFNLGLCGDLGIAH